MKIQISNSTKLRYESRQQLADHDRSSPKGVLASHTFEHLPSNGFVKNAPPSGLTENDGNTPIDQRKTLAVPMHTIHAAIEVMEAAQTRGRTVTTDKHGNVCIASRLTSLLDKLCAMFNYVHRVHARVERVHQALDNALTYTYPAAGGIRHEGMCEHVREFLRTACSEGKLPRANDILREIYLGFAKASEQLDAEENKTNKLSFSDEEDAPKINFENFSLSIDFSDAPSTELPPKQLDAEENETVELSFSDEEDAPKINFENFSLSIDFSDAPSTELPPKQLDAEENETVELSLSDEEDVPKINFENFSLSIDFSDAPSTELPPKQLDAEENETVELRFSDEEDAPKINFENFSLPTDFSDAPSTEVPPKQLDAKKNKGSSQLVRG